MTTSVELNTYLSKCVEDCNALQLTGEGCELELAKQVLTLWDIANELQKLPAENKENELDAFLRARSIYCTTVIRSRCLRGDARVLFEAYMRGAELTLQLEIDVKNRGSYVTSFDEVEPCGCSDAVGYVRSQLDQSGQYDSEVRVFLYGSVGNSQVEALTSAIFKSGGSDVAPRVDRSKGASILQALGLVDVNTEMENWKQAVSETVSQKQPETDSIKLEDTESSHLNVPALRAAINILHKDTLPKDDKTDVQQKLEEIAKRVQSATPVTPKQPTTASQPKPTDKRIWEKLSGYLNVFSDVLDLVDAAADMMTE